MAQMDDVVTPLGGLTGHPGLMIFTFEVSGTNTSMLSGDPLVGNTHFGTNTVVHGCSLPPAAVTPLPFNACTGSAETFDGASYSHVPVTFSFGIVYGDPTAVVFSMNSQAGVRFDPTHAICFSGVTEFLHTMNLTSVELLDHNRQQVTNGALLAESGTLYDRCSRRNGGRAGTWHASALVGWHRDLVRPDVTPTHDRGGTTEPFARLNCRSKPFLAAIFSLVL